MGPEEAGGDDAPSLRRPRQGAEAESAMGDGVCLRNAMEFNFGLAEGLLADALALPDTTVYTHSGRGMYYPCNDVCCCSLI